MEGGRVLGVNSVCSPKPAETRNLFSDTVSAVSLSTFLPFTQTGGTLCPALVTARLPAVPTNSDGSWSAVALHRFWAWRIWAGEAQTQRGVSGRCQPVPKAAEDCRSPKRCRASRRCSLPWCATESSSDARMSSKIPVVLCRSPLPQNIQLQSASDGRRMLLPDGELLNIARRLGFFRDRRAQPAITS